MEKSVSNFGTELSKLTNKTKEIEKIASDVEPAMEFANVEIEVLKKKELVSENRLKSFRINYCIKKYTTGVKICVSSVSLSPSVLPKMYIK